MKNLAVVSLCVIFAVVVWGRPEEPDHYSSQYDDIDLDAILNNDRARKGYISCVKTGKKCTSEGQELRENFPDAIKTGCVKCTERQKEQSKKVLDFILKNHPEEYKELEEMFDPNHEYRKKYEAELKKAGVVLPD